MAWTLNLISGYASFFIPRGGVKMQAVKGRAPGKVGKFQSGLRAEVQGLGY